LPVLVMDDFYGLKSEVSGKTPISIGSSKQRRKPELRIWCLCVFVGERTHHQDTKTPRITGQDYGKVRYFLKIVNLKSPITDNKFREGASPLYLLFVIGDLRFVIFQDHGLCRGRESQGNMWDVPGIICP
jgi:hypothetical protein